MTRNPLAALLRRLDLTPLEDDVFRGEPGRGDGAVFGGLLVAQALVAAGRTTQGGVPHSLHGYFLRPGRYGLPLTWRVRRVRDGLAFTAREVVGEQSGQEVLVLLASFTRQAHGLAHETPMPDAPPPDDLPDWEDLRVEVLGPSVTRRPDGPLEIRDCDPASARPAAGRPARRAIWMRPRGELPDDPLLHAAVLAFGSDRGLLSTAGRPHGLMWGMGLGASLDHAVWLHRPVRFDDWVLYASASPVAVAGRGFVRGAMFRRDGVRLASVAQEGLIRSASRRARS